MTKLHLVLSLIGLIGYSGAQIVQDGQCNRDVHLKNFNADKFAGTWYEIRKSASPTAGDCATIEISKRNGHIYTVNRNVAQKTSQVGTLEDGSAKFTLKLEDSYDATDIWILSTDYNNFALAYSCKNLSPTQRSVSVWQWGRMPVINNGLKTDISNSLRDVDINIDDLQTVDYSRPSCISLFATTRQEVVLSGQCEDVSAVANFDPPRFTGVWHQIRAYPSDNSRGNCNKAQYSLNGGVVDVINSEVVDEKLREIKGIATVISENGSGHLNVTLEVLPGVFASEFLWILDTDYDNYAVSYACRNVDSSTKRVGAWIAGRKKYLSEDSERAVNAVVESYSDLIRDYFIDADQSDDACFYYPDFDPKKPVELEGYCDENIKPKSNFDAAKFTGVWHQFAAYYSESSIGSCNKAEYVLKDGVVDVTNSEVVDQKLREIKGIAIVVSEDGSAKLNVTLEVLPGVFVSQFLWILETDYENFAVSYSCSNVDSSTKRRVGTWVLTRTGNLSEDSQIALDAVFEAYRDLNREYLIAADQSDEACFYYPDFDPTKPVELEGYCDENIKPKSNFDAAKFTGVWHQFAAYYSESSIGSCNKAEYVLKDGVVDVTNSEVVDQKLREIKGIAIVVSEDGSAKLNVTLEVLPGVFVSQFLWILETDYENFAVSYSCSNVDSSTKRRVGTWVLTRTGNLSEDSQIALDAVFEAYRDLNREYLIAADQSDEACFYYPDFDPTKPVELEGYCDENIKPKSNFDAAKFTGVWHQFAAYYSESSIGSCNKAEYVLKDGVVDVTNSEVVDQKLREIKGIAIVVSEDGSAKLNVTLEVLPGVFVSQSLWILETDYENFAVSYSCSNVDSSTKRRVGTWVLTRTGNLSEDSQKALDAVFEAYRDLNREYLIAADQSDEACFYYPDFDPTKPVELVGYCDENLKAKANFDVPRFTGEWYEIAAYPSDNSRGNCKKAQYSLNGGVVDVINSEVVDEKLREIKGIAVVVSEDGSAKLNVTLEVMPGVFASQFLWILDTDYENYAVSYACSNVDRSNKRTVFAFLLSRVKNLSEDSQSALDAVFEDYRDLNREYLIAADQSDEACFVNNEPDLTKPVDLPGQCDENTQAMQNFDAARFTGLWYEIAAYFSESSIGKCNKAQYALNGGVVDVINSEVVDEKLREIKGIATVVSEDGSGKLNVVLEIFPGVFASQFLWIMDTDYENYAISYACTNLDNSTKRVGSWMLGRKKELSEDSKRALDAVIDANSDLIKEYFIDSDQSDDACFYYPEYDEPPSVIELPGPCPDFIRAQENFDAAAYLGRWYEVARYPTGDQSGGPSGGCARAEYSLGDDVVEVYNTQVVGEKLLIQTGTAVVASNDGTGLLNVTFDVGGVIFYANYYVLSTDYTGYALVYSCRNLPNGNSMVSSWILSRERSGPTDQAKEVMKEVIDRTRGLSEDYYLTTSQSDYDCFYYPEFDDVPSIIELPGLCPDFIKGQENFDAAAYLGRWYEVARYPTGDQSGGPSGGCARAEYSLGDDVVEVYNTQVVGEKLLIQTGTAVVASNDGTGLLNVTFDVGGVILYANYYVLSTDYTGYALVYSCRNLPNGNSMVSSWILSRERSGPTDQAKEVMKEVIDRTRGLSEDYYLTTSQSDYDCFYYPEFDDVPSIIELPGPCPDFIKGQENFDAAAYLGRWYEVARYPTGDQSGGPSGGCARAEYSLGDDVVEVYNTQVVGEKLLIQSGTAVVASNDGTGLLNVTFNVGGEIFYANYYVLATDYRSYAIVYSCRDTSDGNRFVSSWKLSRRRSGLTDEAKEVMNEVIKSTQGLLEDYYLNTSQSDIDCFYIPDMNESQDVIFRGKCENIRGVQNFDLQRYLGWWHEIERFPRDVRPGECTSARFQASGNQVTVEDTSVTDQNGEILTSTVTATTDGRLRRTYSNGNVVDTWVLATDYETYSLLYSCEDFVDDDNNDYRRVWSAKHSKSRELTNAAQNVMAPIIENNKVLYPEFYVRVSQSSEACFYYPEPSDRPVMLDGNCDEGIPVEQNFRAGDYTGTWYQIERYPQTFELSTECTGARYSLDESTGIVSLINWEVINGELDTISGNATVISNDGSAKLEVVLPNRGDGGAPTVTYPLYVLTTDYTSYALAYSCVNINQYQRQIGAFKLSRTRSMTTAGNAAINSYMSSRRELDQRYFRQTNQYDGCLEPSSGFLVKSSVIVLLACALVQLWF